jgi:hypothetical protein
MKDYVFCAHAAAKTISLYPGTLMKEDHRPIPPDLPIDMAQPDDDMATPWGELAWGLAAILVLLALGFWLGRVTA